MTSGVLYSSSGLSIKELSVSNLILKLKTIAWGLRNTGSILVLFMFLGIFWLYSPLAYYQIRYRIFNFQFTIFNQFSKFKTSISQKPTWQVPDPSYSIYIPKIQAISKVIPNVSLINEKEYSNALKIGVAEAAGLAHPDQIGTTYLFAHSTNSPFNLARYNAVFYLLNKLTSNDQIQIVYKTKLYKYQVIKTEILMANDTRYLIQDLSEQKLILQTCYPPGTSWKRFMVVARLLTE